MGTRLMLKEFGCSSSELNDSKSPAPVLNSYEGSTAAHISKLAYMKLQYLAVITADCMQIPLQKVSMLLNVRCSIGVKAYLYLD